MWTRIVTNLLSNAVKYTHQGSVRVSLSTVDGEVVLAVTDTGSGIPLGERQRVFDRFYQAPGSGPQEGSGIGLALVAELVAAHSGHIGLASRPATGSTFTVTIPIGDIQTTGPNYSELSPVGTARPDLGSPVVRSPPVVWTARSQVGADDPMLPRLPVVEDDEDLRAYLARLIAADGWSVQAVPDAETALATIGEQPQSGPALVVTDVMLPGRSGLQLVADLRAVPGTARLPIIVLTVLSGQEATTQGWAAGADDYITKPFQSPELLARIRANHRLQQPREQAIDDAETRAEQIRGALDSSRVIGTAIGILMATHRVNSDDVFQLLLAAGQNSNRKLRDVAADVVQGGALPFRPNETDALLLRVSRRQSRRSH
jgi:DNA-binding response OmpR family regulator